MKKFDVVIIGSGLGALECGYILSKKGFNVAVLEKNENFGGNLQTFKRGNLEFDTGFHYVGGLGEGQPLHTLFQYFDLMHLPWHQMDENGFDEVFFNHRSFLFANGFERFSDQLSQQFPHQRQNLKKYSEVLQNVGNHIFDVFNQKNDAMLQSTSLLAQSAYQFLTKTIDDPVLQNVLSGNSLKMELNAETLPLYTFAQINSSFIQSAWRLRGGGNQIVTSLVESIRSMNGTVMNHAKVTQLIERDGKIAEIEINGEDRLSADIVISDVHPATTFEWIRESALIRKIFRQRISSLKNTFGMFTMNVALKENSVAYRNKNMYIYDTEDIWNISQRINPQKTEGILLSFQVPNEGEKYTRNLDIITPMLWSEVEAWAGTEIGHRGADYLDFKAKKAEQCLQTAYRYLPELKGNIDRIYTSTPLSYWNYTATKQGAAYGIQKDYQQLLYTILTPRTPIPNLFLTGQNLNLHGVLGVSITAIYTCAEILGMENIVSDIIR
ncbi:MAG: NAD(P)/FAD-dependent oxidoreductase [Bacteroidales bacterium]|nr:NAD(P)/FAD-dependent oxidoreductase [Bacteroidales bacterium]